MVFSSSKPGSARILHFAAESIGDQLFQFYRSLNCEHIALGGATSAPDLGVPRNILAPALPRRQAIESMRRWFFLRKNGSGFLLSGFPSSLDEAGMLDSWLDESGETLDVCLFPPSLSGVGQLLFRHYEIQGLAWKSSQSAPLPDWIQPSFAS
jgi:hypothetical protein